MQMLCKRYHTNISVIKSLEKFEASPKKIPLPFNSNFLIQSLTIINS